MSGGGGRTRRPPLNLHLAKLRPKGKPANQGREALQGQGMACEGGARRTCARHCPPLSGQQGSTADLGGTSTLSHPAALAARQPRETGWTLQVFSSTFKRKAPRSSAGGFPYLDTLVITGGFFCATREATRGLVKPFFDIFGRTFLSETCICKTPTVCYNRSCSDNLQTTQGGLYLCISVAQTQTLVNLWLTGRARDASCHGRNIGPKQNYSR